MIWRKQLDTQGAGSFYQLRVVRGAAVINAETSAQCQRLLDEGQPIAATALSLAYPAIAGRMFSRWCRENYFGYMMEHYDIDGLVQYGSDEISGATRIVNPAWRELDKQITRRPILAARQDKARHWQKVS